MAAKKNIRETVLVIDDSPDTLEMLHRSLEHMGFNVYSCDNAKEAIEILKKTHIDLVITDYHMPFVGGIDVIRHVRENYKNTEVMMITGYASVEGAVEAIKAGAGEYLSKPFTDEELEQAIGRSLEKLAIRAAKSEAPARSISKQYGIIGESSGMKRVFDSIKKAAADNHPVLISGETGTGKELAARAIHYESKASDYPFIHVNCRGIPESILESEVFGYIKSGDVDQDKRVRPGFLELAGEGTVFFDEISETTPAVQVKLLRAIKSSEILHDGDNTVRTIKCRIMASSSKDLISLVRRGLFREDLFFRLNVINIVMPPLREREKDILLLCNSYITEYCAEAGRSGKPEIDQETSSALLKYTWPGNIRELERLMRQIAYNAEGSIVEVSDLPPHMRFNLVEEGRLGRKLDEVELEHIKAVLSKVGGNKTKAAEMLGIDRKTLREKLGRGKS